ncbi:hypothetical protein V8J36_02535 [Frigidibacter sp. MR17.14]|uniref:hypothetical protein n=1 Tax=Frigidibacter sp. MR17.14 TaxID=3126509 RepID=UPI003012F3BD
MKPLALLALVALAGPALADGPPKDADWPCVQRKVPHLSLGSVWAGPLPDDALEARSQDGAIRETAARLALRRTGEDEARALIAATAPGDRAALYLAVFRDIDHTRDRVMQGIARYARKQTELDTRINALRVEQRGLEGSKDFDRIDTVERDLDWATRIFRERQQSLTYVCEVPVILEQRAFALGREVMAQLQ